MRISAASMGLILIVCSSGCAECTPPLPTFRLAHPENSRTEILRLVRAHDWDSLEARFAGLEQRREDPSGEASLGVAYASFSSGEDAIRDAIRAWVAARPHSATAHLALAVQLEAEGWRRRGSGWASETTDAQLEGMRESHALAVVEAHTAMKLDGDRVEGWLVRMGVANARAGRECEDLAAQALERHPASFSVRALLQTCLSPRWGGSYRAMHRAAKEATPHFERNPRLSSLFGFADADRSNMARMGDRFEEALGFADRALATGEHASFHHERAHSLFQLDRLKEAMAAIDRALELSPGSPEYLVDRAWYWLRQTDDEPARADYELAREIDPTFERLEKLGDMLAERAARPRATIEADALVARARRAWVRHDFDSALADLREAVRIDPAHLSACRHLDRLLAWRRQWGEIIEIWNAYLAGRPDDPAALVERAGALQHAGRKSEALADLARACDLGEKSACDRLEKERALLPDRS